MSELFTAIACKVDYRTLFYALCVAIDKGCRNNWDGFSVEDAMILETAARDIRDHVLNRETSSTQNSVAS